MEIRKNKRFFHHDIKRFALKATASAIITFNAETAIATNNPPCPDYINSLNSPYLLCDFNSNTISSVTVANGGEVGGINMVHQTPSSPSYIAIKTEGTINNTAGAGIIIMSSSLSNGVSNSGTISTDSYGIQIDRTDNSQINSSLSGGITNSGLISCAEGTGVLIKHNSAVTGDIVNSGKIEIIGKTGVDNDFVGIGVLNDATLTGNISNSGSISTYNGSTIYIEASSQINGHISNSGNITSTLQTGVDLNLSSIDGDISNSNTGIISGGYNGVSVNHHSIMTGNISNNGTIKGGQSKPSQHPGFPSSGLSIFSQTTIIGNISNTGTINSDLDDGISIFFTSHVNGMISNSGVISGKNGISILNSSVVRNGIINSGVIQGVDDAINVDGNSQLDNIYIIGQRAKIIGPVEAPNTTVNIKDGAIFTSEGSYNVNSFIIDTDAFFNMKNQITVLDIVKNSGTLAVGATLRNIDGNYSQQPGGLFQLDVSNVNNYGKLSVTGGVDLSLSGDIYVQVNQDTLLHSGDVLSNIIQGTSLDALANELNVNGNSYIWKFVPTPNSNFGINLTATINPEAYKVCQGTYCQGAATTIFKQVAAGNPVFNPYITLSSSNELREAISLATPELNNENIQVVQLITRSIWDAAPMWHTLRGKSAGDAMIYQPGKVWIKPYGGSMTQNRRSTVPGFNATAYGAVIGKDIQLTNDWLFGGGFAAGGDNMHGKSELSGQSINSQAYQGILYSAKTLPNHVYFAGQGLVGYEINDTNRSTPLYPRAAKGSYNSWFTNIRTEMGWSTSVLSPNFIFTPSVDASYLFINQNSYQESGSPIDLLVAPNHNSSLVLGAYGNGAYHLASLHNQQDLTLTGYVGVAGDVINSQPQVVSTFVAGGSSFSTPGVQFNGVVFRGGGGLVITNPLSPLSLELNYNLQVGNNAYSNVGAATIKYKT